MYELVLDSVPAAKQADSIYQVAFISGIPDVI